jgi:hypothetical protein
MLRESVPLREVREINFEENLNTNYERREVFDTLDEIFASYQDSAKEITQ